jgi:hypothetical protein
MRGPALRGYTMARCSLGGLFKRATVYRVYLRTLAFKGPLRWTTDQRTPELVACFFNAKLMFAWGAAGAKNGFPTADLR